MNVWILSVRELARLLRGRLTWLAAALLLCCGWSCAAQPFIDHSNPDLNAMTFLTMEPL